MTRIEKIAVCRPSGIILREKDLSLEEYSMLAIQVMKICDRYDVRCILHSFVDTAITLKAKAVHLPMHILSEMTSKQKNQFDIIGASCHSVNEALKAKDAGCTYITAGHIFETQCKKGLAGRGIEFLKNICRAVDIPVYAIGGIDVKNIALVRDEGANGSCVMSSFMVCEDVEKLMNDLKKKISL